MKREEAIMRLKQNRAAAAFYAKVSNRTKTIESELLDVEAFTMAIEALSQPIVAKCYEIDNDRVYCSPEMADKIYRALHEDTNVQNMHRGEWIDKEIPCNPYPPVFCVECSACGYRVGRETYLENTFNFCPNCGADMRGGAE